MLAGGMLQVEQEAAAAAVFAALERAQRAAEEAASASGALEAAIKRAEKDGAFPSFDEEDLAGSGSSGSDSELFDDDAYE